MVTFRKYPLIEGEIYHIYNKSISGYKIFNSYYDYSRMKRLFVYYSCVRKKKFSEWERGKKKMKKLDEKLDIEEKFVDIIAYCIMPTHIHLILKQKKEKGISIFMSQISNSYAKYFNLKHKRKGPLWEGEFKNVLVSNDEQLLHLTRYIHLNPVTAGLVEKPQDWEFSSYQEYLNEIKDKRICNFKELLDIDPVSYKKFTEDRISYQKELAKIKHLLLEKPITPGGCANKVSVI